MESGRAVNVLVLYLVDTQEFSALDCPEVLADI